MGVKKFVGVHTPTMKAVRAILSAPGFSFGKMAVLVGGPDWPTSVLTGILNLPLCTMLCGSVPVFFLILPCGFAAGYLLRAGEDVENSAWHQAVANICLALSGIMQGGASILATYYIQRMISAHDTGVKIEEWKDDAQEAEIKEAVEADAKKAEELLKRINFAVQPCYNRAILILGSLLSCACVLVALNPVSPPFLKFVITDKVSELPGGTALALVQRSGWCMFGLMGAALGCLMLFQVTGTRHTRKSGASSAETPLIAEDPRR